MSDKIRKQMKNNRYPVAATVPMQDEITIQWLEAQDNLSNSLRVIIKKYVEFCGGQIVDVTCTPVDPTAAYIQTLVNANQQAPVQYVAPVIQQPVVQHAQHTQPIVPTPAPVVQQPQTVVSAPEPVKAVTEPVVESVAPAPIAPVQESTDSGGDFDMDAIFAKQ